MGHPDTKIHRNKRLDQARGRVTLLNNTTQDLADLLRVAGTEHLDMGLGAVRDGLQIVPPFQDGDPSALTERISQGADRVGYPAKRVGRQVDLGERITTMCVEADARQDELRLERVRGREHLFVKGPAVRVVAGTRHHGDVQRAADAFTGAGLPFKAGARKQRVRVLMDADEQRIRVGLEVVLGAVAVMDVPVQDRDPFDRVCDAQILGCDRDVIEEAEPHG